MSDLLAGLHAMLDRGADSAQLRFALASRYFADGDIDRALEHARVALELDPDYSAAWRLLGKLELAAGREAEAAQTFTRGISVAEKKGDRQLVREMRVFLRRLTGSSNEPPGDAS